MKRTSLKSFFTFIALCILSVLIYTQSPLYTSNQNLYFLHGMAQANMGSLSNDWLANTKDPTPLFTQIVRLVFITFHNPFCFYIIHTLLMGLYFWCLFGIVIYLFDIKGNKSTGILVITLILIVHSGAIRYLLGNIFGDMWRYLFDGGIAGQRLLGTIFQPSSFGVLLLVAIYLYIKDKPIWASTIAAMAACIHPTYLFSTALLITGFMLQNWIENKSLKKSMYVGAIALCIVIPILIYVFTNFGSTEGAEEARYILINIRIPHHTLMKYWLDFTAIIKIFLIIISLLLIRKSNRVFTPLFILFCGSMILSIYQVLTGDPVLALIFPWRPSALLVPISSSILLTKFAKWFASKISIKRKEKYLKTICYVVLITLCVIGIYYMKSTYDLKKTARENDMLEWVKNESQEGDRFLIPINLETFRTTTLRPVYIDYLAHPYSNEEVIEWYHRLLATNRFYDTGNCEDLYHLKHDDNLNHIIMERGSIQPVCQDLKIVYQDSYYTIYKSIK